MSSINDFEIINQIGTGAFSKVFKVRRKIDNEIYALKEVNLSSLSDKERENAFTEIKILSSIDNPHVIAYKDSFYEKEKNTIYLIMEYAAYGDLDYQIMNRIKNRVYFNEKEIWDIIEQIVIGLNALHEKQILHRDLKAANIFICDKYFTSLKIGDLNVSKCLNTFTMKNTQTGTPYYASPEVWNNRPYDYKSDIWSLGCLFYELTTLTAPFKGKSMKELYENVEKGIIEPIPRIYTESLFTLIKMCLRHDDKLRPSAIELLDYIKRVKGEKGDSIKRVNQNVKKKIEYVQKDYDGKVENFKFPKSRYKSEIRKRPVLDNIDTQNNDKSFNVLDKIENDGNSRKVIPPIKSVNYHYKQMKLNDDHTNAQQRTEPIVRKITPIKQNFKVVARDKTPLKTDIEQKRKSLNNKDILNKISKMRNKLQGKSKPVDFIEQKIEPVQINPSQENKQSEIDHNKEKINEMKSELESLLKLNIEQSKELASKYLAQQERSKSAMHGRRYNNNCSDNIRRIFEGYSYVENTPSISNNKSSNELPILNKSNVTKAIETTKVNNSFQMFNIFHYQINNTNPKSGKIKKPSVNHYYNKEKLKQIKSKIGPLLKNRKKNK